MEKNSGILGILSRKSVLRNLFLACVGLGSVVGVIFPFFASFFVTFKDGMEFWFNLSCWGSGLLIGLCNYLVINTILVSKLVKMSEVSKAISNNDITLRSDIQSNVVIGEISDSMNIMADNLVAVIRRIADSSHQLSSSVIGCLNSKLKQIWLQQQ